MSEISIYDRPMCCSTGVCGPSVDPVLPRFAGDLQWLQEQGHNVNRFNLSHTPNAFAANDVVTQLLEKEGTDVLPIVMVDGNIVSKADYPERDDLVKFIAAVAPVESGERSASQSSLPVAGGGCCGDSGCC